MSTKTELKQNLEAWQKLKTKINKIHADADGQLADLLLTFEAKAEPINAERERKLADLLPELHRLEKETGAEMLKAIRADGTIGIPQIETTGALAQIALDRKRKITPAAFMRAVHPSKRQTPEFFACLSVLVTEAEKFLDKPTMERLTDYKLTPSVIFKLKG